MRSPIWKEHMRQAEDAHRIAIRLTRARDYRRAKLWMDIHGDKLRDAKGSKGVRYHASND